MKAAPLLLRFAAALALSQASLAPRALADPLAPVLSALQDPGAAPGPVRAQVDRWLRGLAPRVWFHADEPYAPMDPEEFVRRSSLWRKSGWWASKRLAETGKVDPKALKAEGGTIRVVRPFTGPGGTWSPEGVYLRYDGIAEPPRADRRPAGQGAGSTTDEPGSDAPMLWRLGDQRVARAIGEPPPGKQRVLIEFWYHLPFSRGTRIGFGNHQGDWEGMAAVLDLSVEKKGALAGEWVAIYLAAHEGGRWHCASELQWTGQESGGRRPELYSAVGTHATYARPGRFWTGVIFDETGRGKVWEGWKRLRPLAGESYYGFAGAWGDVGMGSFMTGPLAPGPGFKGLPQPKVAADTEALGEVGKRCRKGSG